MYLLNSYKTETKYYILIILLYSIETNHLLSILKLLNIQAVKCKLIFMFFVNIYIFYEKKYTSRLHIYFCWKMFPIYKLLILY